MLVLLDLTWFWFDLINFEKRQIEASVIKIRFSPLQNDCSALVRHLMKKGSGIKSLIFLMLRHKTFAQINIKQILKKSKQNKNRSNRTSIRRRTLIRIAQVSNHDRWGTRDFWMDTPSQRTSVHLLNANNSFGLRQAGDRARICPGSPLQLRLGNTALPSLCQGHSLVPY